jgi:hypothetical protein
MSFPRKRESKAFRKRNWVPAFAGMTPLLYLRPDLTCPKCHAQKSFGWDWPQTFMSFPRKRESRAWESRAGCTLSRARDFDCSVR